MNDVPGQPFVVALSKKKIVLILLGALAFVATSVWLWTIAEHQARHSPVYIKALAVIGGGFFGLCGALALVKLIDKVPGLIIDADGIVDNSSGFSAGRIPWREIKAVKVSRVYNQSFLTFEVVDPMKYVEKGHFLRRLLNSANFKYSGSPIHISANTLRINFDELLKVTLRYYNSQKNV